MEIEIGRFAGLPAHALFVHIPIVLTPLTAAGSISVAVSAQWRRRIGVIVLGCAVLLAIATQLAIGSGEALREAIRKTPLVKTHAGQSDLLEPVMLALLLCVIVILWLDRRSLRPDTSRLQRLLQARLRVISTAVTVATIVVALTALGLVIRAGHSGSKAVWKENKELVRPLP
jgi:hypothetical protein